MLTTSAFLALALQCAPAVHPSTLYPVVKTESAFNPYAIGVKDGALPRQPQSLQEALAAVKGLVDKGASFAVGLGQIHRQHFDARDPRQVAELFEPCHNLKLSGDVLRRCYAAARPGSASDQDALRKAISCYYSGNFTTGLKPEAEFGGTSHVQRVLANADLPVVPALQGQGSSTPGGTVSSPPAGTPLAPQPTYQSWDVLRQYPRFDPPGAVQPKAQPTKEQEDTSDAAHIEQ
ncbi:lytic transglycosylase [Pseudomonas protegens]|uniref:Lytic transglycosylase n=1 Tax=Pseudomonas protegens TaxID=380021 RepID=A0A2T6GBI5_9PSED|nr:lytic transglycosylase domain-containing protein [Pseudomonas protegens]PUA41512.1 lytic transglycosylase [Pseudomonas protegens]